MYLQKNFSKASVNVGNIARTLNKHNRKENKVGWTSDSAVRFLSTTQKRHNVLQFSKEVQEAKKQNFPIVALESTIITHGMPFPDNLTTAVRVEEIIREKGAVPATIAILDGKIHVGMERDCLERVAKCTSDLGEKEKTTKCSRRDISTVISRKLNGGTTVGGTMTIARMAKIPIMATGGIGGVHRGAEINFDVSSDLTELGRNRVAVVCAGVKAILDIPKTLEYLETQGVPVATIGQSDNFPAFYCRETSRNNPVKSPSRVSDIEEAAKLLRHQEILELENGILFAVPIPEAHALDSHVVESMIRDALRISEEKGIRGKHVTPFLLEQLNRLASGGFLKANQALVENNAGVAAEIAVALNSLRIKIDKGSSSSSKSGVEKPLSGVEAPAVVIGGATVDTTLHVLDETITLDGRTHRAKSRESHGGVGRNVTAAMIALGLDNTRLLTVVGNDSAGRSILDQLGDAGEQIQVSSDAVTARYTAILDKTGDCRFGIGEMDVFSKIGVDIVSKNRATIENAGLLVLDGNLPRETLRASVKLAAENNVPVWYEPTDVSKASKILQACSEWIDLSGERNLEDAIIRIISPNLNELFAIAKYLGINFGNIENENSKNLSSCQDDLSVESISRLAEQVAKVFPVVITTLGSRGIIVTRRESRLNPIVTPRKKSHNLKKIPSNGKLESRWYPAPIVEKQGEDENFSASGCGDCLTAAIITGSYRGLNEIDCIKIALEAAVISLKSYEPVPRSLRELRKFVSTS
ncbi:pseudouridine-metabolizing bifunctional protein C1861.05 [Venturia canescens]|uniref:pseudouridine-metabolizing bifunctional protein C1861.05 n=1 Tax=Venturia canescens TaxID=32260 RepID=UPI001C9CAFB6|nr:pseudouridine-metabolizing bifunctional protein C1861.05 [Venturia canescens]